MRRTFPLIAIAALMVPTAVVARQLTPEQALIRAQGYNIVNNIHANAASRGAQLQYTHTQDNMNTLYVFDRGDQPGFVVVPADDDVQTAILGYSDTATWPTNCELQENLMWWLGQYSDQIAWRVKQGAVTQTEATSTDRTPIEPFSRALWNQLSPYNLYCPTIGTKRCPTGCVATAMAEAMYVYKWPETGTGSHSYKPYSVGQTLTANFADTTFRWDLMTDTYSSASSIESQHAVASLMSCCGIAVNMSYNTTASGSNNPAAAKALVNYFGYDKSLRVLSRDYFGITEWEDLIHSELAQGHPVIYGGVNDEAGHCFIVDGYKGENYFHLNWGWGGVSNGYFLLTALNPSEQGVGGSSSGYNMNQTAIIGLKKAEEGSTVIPVMQFNSNFETGDSVYVHTASVKFRDTRGIFNQSIAGINVTMGVKLVAEDGTTTYAAAAAPLSLVAGQAVVSYNIAGTEFPTSGTYTVTPAVLNQENNTWYDCYVGMEYDRYLTLIASSDSLIFEPATRSDIRSLSFELFTPIFPGKDCGIRATLTNVGYQEFYQHVTPVLVQNDHEKATSDAIAVDLVPGEVDYYTWVGNFPSSLATGDYQLYLIDEYDKYLTDPIDVTVKAAPTRSTVVNTTIRLDNSPTTGESIDEPATCDYSKFGATIKVECTSGYFSGQVQGLIFYNETQGLNEIYGSFIGVEAGQSDSIHYSMDLSGYDKDHVYYFYPYAASYGRLGSPMYFTATQEAGIQQVDMDEVTLALSPNPATDMVTITAPTAITSIQVYGLDGRYVMGVNPLGSASYTINVSAFPAGVYLVGVHTATGGMAVERMIKR